MESIVLEVDDALAKAWKKASPSLKATYEDKLRAVLFDFQTEEVERNGPTKKQQVFLDAEERAEEYEWWKDDDLIAELERRSADLQSGADKGFTIEESKAHLMTALKKHGR